MIAFIATGGKTPLREIIEKLAAEKEKVYVCDRVLFPIVNRTLNEHGYTAFVTGFTQFEEGPKSCNPIHDGIGFQIVPGYTSREAT